MNEKQDGNIFDLPNRDYFVKIMKLLTWDHSKDIDKVTGIPKVTIFNNKNPTRI